VQMIPGVLREPPLHGRGFMRAQIVENEVNVETGRPLRVDRGEKLTNSMAR